MRYRVLLLAAFAGCLMGAVKANAVPIDDPPGTYQQSCKDISVRGDDLRARCKDNYSHYHDAVLDHADRCWGDIANNNGHLVCVQGGGPQGSFTQTCRDIRVRWNVLQARCQARDGRWMDASLDRYSQCRSEIINDDGQLRCGGRGWDHDRDRDRDRGYVPPGSYSQSCRDIRTRGDDLIALCMTVNRQWVDTTLDHYDRCVGEIINDDGRLECTRRGGRLVPRGSYSETCRNIYVRGDYLRAECEDRRGEWRWSQLNDWDDCRRGIENDDGRLRCNR